jgi:hypothetical protein
MFDYSQRIEAFRAQKVILSQDFRDKLLAHRKANRDRLISRLPDQISGVAIGDNSFRPQGSFAMQTVIQTRFADEEYDIDDGLILRRSQLLDKEGNELTAAVVKDKVREALKDGRFNRQPRLCSNCVRVFYADTDEEKHHVDFPAYRIWEDAQGNEQRELAGESGWIASDPTAVNEWLATEVTTRNTATAGHGTQLRHCIQLLKRFCRSRKKSEWDLPNGMKLTMLVAECQGAYAARIDVAFRDLLGRVRDRLRWNKVIPNLAHPDKPALTRTTSDQNVADLETRLDEALKKLSVLDGKDGDDIDVVRRAWDWVFKSDGFFAEFDDEETEKAASHSTSALALRTQFMVPWRERPTWPRDVRYHVKLDGKYAQNSHSLQWTRFESDGDPLPKHLALRFFAQTDTPPPYHAYWQVVNTGTEALNAGCKRGQIVPSSTAGVGGLHSTTAAGLSHDEATLYSGSHWVECFIVKNGKCVARSHPFVVNIR